MATLYPYQRAGLVYALRRFGRVLLADEMGCGKTMQAVALIATALETGPVLVLCPAAVRPMWMFELDRWLDSCGSSGRVVALRGIDGQFEAWYVVAYTNNMNVIQCPFSIQISYRNSREKILILYKDFYRMLSYAVYKDLFVAIGSIV
jgi:SNF2 family DNA or RNA helicase